MTHDELLKKIQSNYEENKHFRDQPDWKSFKALRAVVEVHKPEGVYCFACAGTYDDAQEYPCPTIQAIEKELL